MLNKKVIHPNTVQVAYLKFGSKLKGPNHGVKTINVKILKGERSCRRRLFQEWKLERGYVGNGIMRRLKRYNYEAPMQIVNSVARRKKQEDREVAALVVWLHRSR
ncbi:hypothetical protein PIB30_059508 [Stylosanthes scabra]|uniref:Uncharacterized protein n=1 Tax=Stylosanthes scabra TaxID=79078 RepID=A0ABU6YKT2_9FABA|nr:hypothetical protein [Stylosanthes scabra]